MKAISIIAATNNVIAQIETKILALIISFFTLCCIIRRINQTLSAKAVEYERNSSHANGNIIKEKKTTMGGRPAVMLSAAITTPVLYKT